MHLAAEQQAVSAARILEVSAVEDLADRARAMVGIEVAYPVESYESRNDPMPPHFGSAKYAAGVVIGGVLREPVSVTRVTSETRPPVTAELQNLHDHVCL